jgi:SnoaL-like domain
MFSLPLLSRLPAWLVWAGVLAVLPPQVTAAPRTPLQQLADEAELGRIPVAINAAVDLKDWPRARSFFARELRADFTSLAGGQPATIPADALIAGWSGNLKGDKESLHMLGGTLVTINGDKATVFATGYAYNRKPGGPDGELWEVWGRYAYTMTRTTGGWKVDGLTFAKTFERGSNWVKSTPGQ